MDPKHKTEQVINAWLEETKDMPITLGLNKLAFRIIEALEEAEQVGRGHRAEVPPFDEYYHEEVTLIVERIYLVIIVGASILALKHPDFVGLNADLLRQIIKKLVPYVYEHTPPDILAEWDRVLERGGD